MVRQDVLFYLPSNLPTYLPFCLGRQRRRRNAAASAQSRAARAERRDEAVDNSEAETDARAKTGGGCREDVFSHDLKERFPRGLGLDAMPPSTQTG